MIYFKNSWRTPAISRQSWFLNKEEEEMNINYNFECNELNYHPKNRVKCLAKMPSALVKINLSAIFNEIGELLDTED